jgi:hypothetical protein
MGIDCQWKQFFRNGFERQLYFIYSWVLLSLWLERKFSKKHINLWVLIVIRKKSSQITQFKRILWKLKEEIERVCRCWWTVFFLLSVHTVVGTSSSGKVMAGTVPRRKGAVMQKKKERDVRKEKRRERWTWLWGLSGIWLN